MGVCGTDAAYLGPTGHWLSGAAREVLDYIEIALPYARRQNSKCHRGNEARGWRREDRAPRQERVTLTKQVRFARIQIIASHRCGLSLCASSNPIASLSSASRRGWSRATSGRAILRRHVRWAQRGQSRWMRFHQYERGHSSIYVLLPMKEVSMASDKSPIPPDEPDWDVIVIGSGMGGMSTAAALSRMGHRVLLLEQAEKIGGLTQTFSRNGFTWDVGMHYCGTFGHDQPAGKVLHWLSDGTVEFRSFGPVYDVLHFPDELEIAVARPAEAYKMELKDHFPDNSAEIDAYFEALEAGDAAARMIAAERAMPEPFRFAHRWWNNKRIQRWCGRTTGAVIAGMVSDPKLAAVLSAHWATYGSAPDVGSFGVHAMIIGHYLEGAGYPVGGAASIAQALVPVIEGAGGSARTDAAVSDVLVENGEAIGVRTGSGAEFHAPVVVSAIGARETVMRLLPQEFRELEWAVEVAGFRPSVCHYQMFLGLEGDIARHGATRANHWFFESWDSSDGIWSDVDKDPVMSFVSFPTLKDAAHDPGPSNRHTGELMVWADWSPVAPFADGGAESHPDEWAAFKEGVETRLMAIFEDRFPALVPFVVYRELGTPLATASITGHDKGGFYGIETTPRRMLSEALNARTPIPGLFLTGQDVMMPGIAGALWGGLLGAAAVDSRVFQKFR